MKLSALAFRMGLASTHRTLEAVFGDLDGGPMRTAIGVAGSYFYRPACLMGTVAASEKLLAARPAEHQGGRARGPTAESAEIAEHIREYEALRAAHARVVSIYDSILTELRALLTGSAEIEVHRIHYKHQDALGAAVKAANGDGSAPSPSGRA